MRLLVIGVKQRAIKTVSLAEGALAMGSAIVRLVRKKASRDILRSYKVFIDGRLVGTIRQGSTCEFEIQPGRHDVFLTIDWCSSPHLPLDIVPDEEVKLICQGRNLFRLLDIYLYPQEYITLYREI